MRSRAQSPAFLFLFGGLQTTLGFYPKLRSARLSVWGVGYSEHIPRLKASPYKARGDNP